MGAGGAPRAQAAPHPDLARGARGPRTQRTRPPHLLEGLEPLLEAGGQHEVAAAGQRGQLLPQVGVLAQGQVPEPHVGSHGPPGPGPGAFAGLELRLAGAGGVGVVRAAGLSALHASLAGALGAGPRARAFLSRGRAGARGGGRGGVADARPLPWPGLCSVVLDGALDARPELA